MTNSLKCHAFLNDAINNINDIEHLCDKPDGLLVYVPLVTPPSAGLR